MSYYRMIDITNKSISCRRACFFGSIFVGKNVLTLIKEKKVEKGDPLVLAEIAGINAIKNTSNFVLLCHQINIENIFFNICIDELSYNINVYCFVFANSKTGVEMEAQVGVFAALVTIYDLTKKYNPYSLIYDIKLLFKDGGETGVLGSLDNLPDNFKKFFIKKNYNFNNISSFLVTVSDRASFGRYDDLSGKVLSDFFIYNKCKSIYKLIVPDDKFIMYNVLKNYMDLNSPNILITTGGTGISSRDITFDVINNLSNKIIPGIGELLRVSGSNYSNNSWLSRSISAVYNKTLIISLPGKPSSVSESLNLLGDLITHAIHIINEL